MVLTTSKTKASIVTYTGREISPLNPNPKDISIIDIAKALSQLCRYTGHPKFLYTVAQHSVLLSDRVPEEWAMHALLHDAPEAYLGDLSSPLKETDDLGRVYRKYERIMQRAIWEAFGLENGIPFEVEKADKMMLATEADQIMPRNFPEYGYERFDLKIVPWSEKRAEREFILRYEELM